MQLKGKHNSKLTLYARELRKNMTKQEKHLWYDFLRLYPVKILRQKTIGYFIADFYCAGAKLVIEIDGSQHFTKDGKQYDSEREDVMRNLGIKTVRYTNNDIDRQFAAVCNDIDVNIKNRLR
ncbi:MAG: endonuclease domain-containing protein [Oscillospiraceae bacterium]|nr:endonuclease domain-containing protein [Oscillospiraceae bacterium]